MAIHYIMHHKLFQPQPANTRLMQVSCKVYLMMYYKSDKDDEWDIIKNTEGKMWVKEKCEECSEAPGL